MAEGTARPGKIDRELVGDAMAIGDRTLRLFGRVTGWTGGGNGQGTGGGARLRIEPEAVLVREADGSERRVEISGGPSQQIRRLAMVAAIPVVVWLVVRVLRG